MFAWRRPSMRSAIELVKHVLDEIRDKDKIVTFLLNFRGHSVIDRINLGTPELVDYGDETGLTVQEKAVSTAFKSETTKVMSTKWRQRSLVLIVAAGRS